MSLIGMEIAKMHMADIIHGDLTSSNMMLRQFSSSTSSQSQNLPKPELVRLLTIFWRSAMQ